MSKAIEVLSRGIGDMGTTALDWYQKKALAEEEQARKQQDLSRYLGVMDKAPLRPDETPIDERQRQIEYLRAGGQQENLKALPFGAGEDYWSQLQKKQMAEERAKQQADLMAQRIQGSLDLQDRKTTAGKDLESQRNANRANLQEDRQKHDKVMVQLRSNASAALKNLASKIQNERDQKRREDMVNAHQNALARIKAAQNKYEAAATEKEQKAALLDIQSANRQLEKAATGGGVRAPKDETPKPPKETPKKIRAGNLEFTNQKAANVWLKATPEQRRALAQKYGGFKQARDAIEAATK